MKPGLWVMGYGLWDKRKKHGVLLLVFGLWSLIFGMSGCGPSYPKSKFKESVVRVCKKEYGLDIKVETLGKTVAVYLPLENLIDFTFSITKSASEKINNVILSVSRVALSSDARFEHYCIIAHDVRIPEVQIVIIKSVDDVKRFLLSDISRNEYSKRMIIDIRLSPQAQKERAIKEVFERMKLDKKWQEEVLNDFFRSEPAGLGDIGYWNDRFYVKDISQAEFLAEQIASRLRFAFREEKELSEPFLMKSVKCLYAAKGDKHFFKIDILVDNKFFEKPETEDTSNVIFKNVLATAAHVVHSYNFRNFDYAEVWDQKNKEYLKISRDQLEEFRTGKIKLEEIMQGKTAV